MAMGIDPARDVRQLVMTHLHHDHTGGLHHFPHTEILAAEDGLRAARRQRGLVGAVPRSWPRWFDPKPYTFDAGPLGPFARSARLTRDGSISVVETPGHMVGQVNVIVRGEDVTYILAGDLTYNEKNLIEDKVDGVTMNVQTSLESQRAIKALARAEPSVLLPAHDPDAAKRLANRQCMFDAEPDAKGASNNVANNAKTTLRA
jgi:glyoxylase-like metal-dependent hydrolase (beta-lactamase superfamily II)